VERPAIDKEQVEAVVTTYTIHPGVAETVRATADPAVLNAVDVEMGNFHTAVIQHGLKLEMEGGGHAVVTSARRAAPYLLRQERWQEAAVSLQEMVRRDQSPESLAFALPLLRRIVQATGGNEKRREYIGLLANALSLAGRIDEAEPMLRDGMETARAAAQRNYSLASTFAESLIHLLERRGRLEEALEVVGEMAGYTERAGLGLWTQLNDEAQGLRIMVATGRYDEVLSAVESLRPRMDALPLKSDAPENVDPRQVRETLLAAGREAALRGERWDRALALNAEIVKSALERGAEPLEEASIRFNDYGPLLQLRRYGGARDLLMFCRAVFEEKRAIKMLGKVYGAFAQLEHTIDGGAAAQRFGEVALGYLYQVSEPFYCAGGHHNLANYLEDQGADPATVLAQRMAGAVINLQIQSGELDNTVRNLANSMLPPAPPSFAEVAQRVQSIDGVRFQQLFETLPRTVPDGDAAIAAVWQMVADEKARCHERKQRQAAVLASAPATVRAAFELEGDEFGAAFEAALAELNPVEAVALRKRLREADLIEGSGGPNLTEVLQRFEPLLQGIAAAVDDEGLRAEIEPVLEQVEQQGWRLTAAVHGIWNGERDAEALTAGLDEQDSALIRRLLDMLNP
jgi:hypothetical protein